MRDCEGKGYIKEGIDGREMGWRQLQMCGYSFTLRQTLSLSLSLSLSPFSFTFWFMFQSILFVMEKWESGLKCMGGIGPLFFVVFEIVPFRFTFSFIPSLNFFLCSSSMIYLSFFLVLEVLIYSVEVVSGVWTKLVHLWISKH